MKYFAKIKYLGTAFHGFQVQPELRTVQSELSEGLSRVFGETPRVTGCSRTDAGVHANEFCVKIESDLATVPPEKLPIAVARFLPPDLSLFYAEECSDEFHPRYDVVSKEYLYRIKNRKIYDPFDYGRAWFLPRQINSEGLSRMRKASEYIIGKYDFSAFMSEGADTEDTVREVFYLKIDSVGDEIDVRICADGFLYNMVRIIVGTLVEVAYGRFSPEYIKDIIDSRERKNAGMTAPPEGLYLNKVKY
jgi:tRNA pseudouridine38-40 synthase